MLETTESKQVDFWATSGRGFVMKVGPSQVSYSCPIITYR